MSQYPGSPPPSPRRPIKTALHQAVLDCRLHQVRLLVNRHGVNVDSRDLHGRTPLMLACMIGEEHGQKMAKIFLQAGALMSLRDGMGRSALSYACMNGRFLIVQQILREDILDINEPDNDGITPLHHATMSGNPNIVHFLVDCFVKFGLNVDTRTKLGYTPLLLACKNGHYVSAFYLLNIGKASPTLRDNEFFLNASDWTQRSYSVRINISRRRFAPASAPPLSSSFSRESTMYQRAFTPICQHVKSEPNILSWSSGNPFRLPKLIDSETFIDGKEARQMVLNEIDNVESKTRPTSERTSTTRLTHPPTAKLRALTRSKTTIIPDMVSIFRAYSEQYEPDWRTLIQRSPTRDTFGLPTIEISSS